MKKGMKWSFFLLDKRGIQYTGELFFIGQSGN